MDEKPRTTGGRHRGADRRVLLVADEADRGQEHTAHLHVRPVVPDRGHCQFRGHRRRYQVSLHEKVSSRQRISADHHHFHLL